MKIAFYNVENLFDTFNDPFVNDDDFTPASRLSWHEKRYILKLNRIAKVIRAIEEPMPLAIGLAEVENRKVLQDLVTAMGMSENEAGIVHEESPDERGIDVGFLYRKQEFRKISSTSLRVIFEEDYHDRTRDILHVKGTLKNDEIIHFFVNHWPSRREGSKLTQVKRIQAAKVLGKEIMKINEAEKEPKIIVMGDLNCDPDSVPVKIIRQSDKPGKDKLINLGTEVHKSGKGSINYKGKWLLFDQILASPEFMENKHGINIVPGSFRVLSESWMMFYNSKYKDFRPNKTYGGRKYHGGFSDHLPVYISVSMGNK